MPWVVLERQWVQAWSSVNYASSLLCARAIYSSCGIELTCACLTRFGNIADVQYVLGFPALGTMRTYIPHGLVSLSIPRKEPERTPCTWQGRTMKVNHRLSPRKVPLLQEIREDHPGMGRKAEPPGILSAEIPGEG